MTSSSSWILLNIYIYHIYVYNIYIYTCIYINTDSYIYLVYILYIVVIKSNAAKEKNMKKDYKQFINEIIQIHNSLCYQQATNYYA